MGTCSIRNRQIFTRGVFDDAFSASINMHKNASLRMGLVDLRLYIYEMHVSVIKLQAWVKLELRMTSLASPRG